MCKNIFAEKDCFNAERCVLIKVSNFLPMSSFFSLLEGQYQTVDEFATDCRLVIENTKTFYGGRDEGVIFIEHAEQLNRVLTQQLDAFNRFLTSNPGLQLKAKAAAKMSPNGPPLFPKPTVAALMGVLADMRDLSYTDKATKASCFIPIMVLLARI